MTADLFAELPDTRPDIESLADGACVLPGFARHSDEQILRALDSILTTSPLCQMITPGGRRMSVITASCGHAGWVSDFHGYRYSTVDPTNKRPWPPIPQPFLDLASSAAHKGGFDNFVPDSCLINCYEPGARMSLHQDKNEQDFTAPIVSVSLGLPAIFLFGGALRSDRPRRYRLEHGDVAVWGGRARLAFHGVAPVGEGYHSLIGRRRINLTFRKAL